MNIRELIEKLSQFDQELPVFFETETGPAPIKGVIHTPIVYVSADEEDGVVIGQDIDPDSWAESVASDREARLRYKAKFQCE